MPLKLTQEIKDKIREQFEENPHVVSVGYGYKISGGVNTGELAIVYGIETKKPLSEIPEEEVLPTDFDLNGSIVKTDVKEVGKAELLSCEEDCGEDAGSGSNLNRAKTRPLKGGLSITSLNQAAAVGTLGIIVKDSRSGALVGLTNNHVIIKDAFETADQDLASTASNEFDPIDYIYQDAEYVGVPPEDNIIGRSLRYVPLKKWDAGSQWNQVDGCNVFLRSDRDRC